MEDKFVLGAIDSPVDLRDYDYSMISCSSEEIEIPKEYLLDYDYPILNQGLIGSCVAHALSCMKSYIDGTNDNNMYSVGFIYANRQDNDWQGTGMITREALKNLVKYGDCKKSSFPVNEEYPSIIDTLNRYGKDKLLDEADDHKSLAYISLDKENIKEYLVKYQKPILITVRVYDNFYNANTNKGIIPAEPKGDKKGNHALLCIGYNNDTLILINSWGDYNGDKGKYYLDINSSIIKELWVLEDKKQIKEPEKKKYKVGWNKDDKGWWFSTDGETYCKNEWKQIKGEYYYFDKEGYALNGEWIQSQTSKKWYYLEKDTCKMLSNCWVKDKGKWYRLEKDGSMLIGWFQDSDSKWYYLDINQGYMYSDTTILIDGKYYSFDSSGAWIENNSLVSNALIEFIKSYEGYSNTVYKCSAGVSTIGYGTTREECIAKGTCTKEQAKKWLKEDIEVVAKAIKDKNISLKQNEIDALVSFAYNCGTGALFGSTLWKNVKAGVRTESLIKSYFQSWSYAGKKKLEGLYRRRTKEANMFLYADYTGNV